MEKKYSRVAVLKGGVSSERDVSLKSGAAIAGGLRDAGYDVVEVDVTRRDLILPTDIEAVFIALHGAFGEDGEIQQLLEARGIPYTGSDAASSRLSFDKVLTRERLAASGIPIPDGEVLKNASDRTLPFPVVAKPPREGSSVGCHIVEDEAHWEEAFADAVRYSGEVLAEAYIPGRELTVGILEQGAERGARGDAPPLQVLPVVEIIPGGDWYDYAAKYMTGDTRYSVPAALDPEKAGKLQSIALKTFESLDAAGFGRVDFRLSPEGRPFVLELNAIPGFTATSLLPKAAQAEGIGFTELCCRIMELARNR